MVDEERTRSGGGWRLVAGGARGAGELEPSMVPLMTDAAGQRDDGLLGRARPAAWCCGRSTQTRGASHSQVHRQHCSRAWPSG